MINQGRTILLEKSTRARHFRRLEVKGMNLVLRCGSAGVAGALSEHQTVLKCRSKSELEARIQTWMGWWLEAGFAQKDVDGMEAGVVATLESPLGPGRIRLDKEVDDVYFGREQNEAGPLKQGQRVLVSGIHLRRDEPPAFMFGSKSAVRCVKALAARGKKVLPRPLEFLPEDRARLIEMAGEDLAGQRSRPGCMRDAQIGDLIFSYEKGISRLLGFEPGYDDSRKRVDPRGGVTSEEVFNSKLLRAPGFVGHTWAGWCAPIPKALADAIRAATKAAVAEKTSTAARIPKHGAER